MSGSAALNCLGDADGDGKGLDGKRAKKARMINWVKMSMALCIVVGQCDETSFCDKCQKATINVTACEGRSSAGRMIFRCRSSTSFDGASRLKVRRRMLHMRGGIINPMTASFRFHIEVQNCCGSTGVPSSQTIGSSISNGSLSSKVPSKASPLWTGKAMRC